METLETAFVVVLWTLSAAAFLLAADQTIRVVVTFVLGISG
ncbi:MAG TPA: hypothetical protein VLJ17_17925 [Xanthobacteraceae bacterium]|nr:hypothetical protein [Xanthobacteraceae bacterium]